MVVQSCFWFSPNVREHIEEVHLNFAKVVRVPSKVGVVPANVCFSAGNLPREQIRFVKEQNNGYAFEVYVVHDCVEDI